LIYLKRDIDQCKEKDVKGVYRENIGKTGLVGVEIPFEEPTSVELVLNNDEMTVEESFKKILDYIHEI
jgi:adenylylsulfate kinase-like enzyme